MSPSRRGDKEHVLSRGSDAREFWMLMPCNGTLLGSLLPNWRPNRTTVQKPTTDTTLGYSIKAVSGAATNWVSIASDGQAAPSSVELTFKLPSATVETLTNKLVTTPMVEGNTPPAATNSATGLKP